MSDTGVAAHEPDAWLLRLDPLTNRDLRGRLLGVLALLAVSALPILFLAPLFEAPFDRDQGGYATIARGWLDGSIPYRDLWDNKAPILFLWYGASFQWLGETVVAPRVMAALAAALSVPFVWATTRTLFGSREAALAAGVYALSFGNIYLQVTANAEVFMLLPLTAGLWAFASGARSGNPLWFAAAGALTALAVFTRQSALWAFVGYGAWMGVLFVRYPEERWPQIKAGLAITAGVAAVAVPFVVYFAANDALYDLWYGMFEFNRAWAGEFPLWRKLIPPIFQNPLPLIGGLIIWTVAAVGVWRLWLRGDRSAWLVISLLVVMELAAQTLGKGSPHYSIHLLPGAAIAAGVGSRWLVERWREGRRGMVPWVAATTVVSLAAAVFLYAQPTPADRFEVQYGLSSYAERAVVAPRIAEAVEEVTEPGDYVYEWGRDSEVYFLADRQPASRWMHDRPYSVDKSVIDEVVEDLEAKRPTVVYYTIGGTSAAPREARPPEPLAEYVDKHYEFATRVEYADIYTLRDE